MLSELAPQEMREMQRLIESNFTGRDELYAAAQFLDDEFKGHLCRYLGEILAGNAIELRQFLTRCGIDPAEPLDVEEVARLLFTLAKSNRGEQGVLCVAVEGEENLKTDYDRAIHATGEPAARTMLRRQREKVEFGQRLLRRICHLA